MTKITPVQIQFWPKPFYKIKFILKHICQTLIQTYTKQINSLISIFFLFNLHASFSHLPLHMNQALI